QATGLAERLAMIRNHGEVHETLARAHPVIGWNFRLTELNAAIALEQTRKMKGLVQRRRELARRLIALLADFSWVRPPVVEPGCEHTFYDFPMLFDLALLGLGKSELMAMTAAENLPITESY